MLVRAHTLLHQVKSGCERNLRVSGRKFDALHFFDSSSNMTLCLDVCVHMRVRACVHARACVQVSARWNVFSVLQFVRVQNEPEWILGHS